MSAPGRTRLYREFLTPALHRRFTTAAGLALLICYAEAVIIGEKSSFLWLWFPIGRAGIRTLLLFLCVLSVFVLRVAQLHIGVRNTASPFETFKQYLFRFNTIQTLAWYSFSGWWFSEVYMWSAPNSANLHWVAEGRSYERPRLNERPIYLRSFFFTLAVMQSMYHLYYDYDKVTLPVAKPKSDTVADQQPPVMVSPLTRMRAALLQLLQTVVQRSLPMIVVGPITYSLLIRRRAWSWTLFFAKLLWKLPKAAEPPRIPPYHISLLLRSISSCFLIIILWEASNAIFSAYVAQDPLKRGQPLTNYSPDPNGSLLNGLKSRKEAPKTFAFWELSHICQCFEVRRKSIFTEIDRAGGTTWSQTMNACVAVIQGIDTRIADYQNPPVTASPLSMQQQNQVQSLPRLSAPLRQDQITVNPLPPTTSRERIQSNIGTVAKSFGQSPSSPNVKSSPSPLSPRARQYLGTARNKLLTQGQQEAISPASLKSQLNHYLMEFLRSPVGRPFRQTFQRRLCAVVLGTPYSELHIAVNAIDALTHLAVASLKEDTFGKVQKDIPDLIRTLVNTTTRLESFVNGFAVHWTDVDFPDTDGRGRRVEEVEMVLDSLKSGLRMLVSAFEDYAVELGLGPAEMRIARVVAGSDP
ncbi:MAG: nuclear envelope [Lasallia pustulata]|uniref:Nuclear envelope n=1 Tax=Lasallia pustulata TaxID=136370 RepID=A0A5M8PNA1_9LECA|nr:MAG: nuclear envelope [Lasallia pustulata]